MPDIALDTTSCAALWETAPEIAVIMIPYRKCSISDIMITETIPPARLIKNAVIPRVASTKQDLRTAIARASGRPSADAVNIVMIFENPGFAPGGKNEKAGIRLSANERASACARSIPISAVL